MRQMLELQKEPFDGSSVPSNAIVPSGFELRSMDQFNEDAFQTALDHQKMHQAYSQQAQKKNEDAKLESEDKDKIPLEKRKNSELTEEELREKKKKKNTDAVRKYRQKKKAKMESYNAQLKLYQQENIALKIKYRDLMNQVVMLKDALAQAEFYGSEHVPGHQMHQLPPSGHQLPPPCHQLPPPGHSLSTQSHQFDVTKAHSFAESPESFVDQTRRM
eukprot:Nk52_evm46s248 gene=Nk52_evmTU46s248